MNNSNNPNSSENTQDNVRKETGDGPDETANLHRLSDDGADTAHSGQGSEVAALKAEVEKFKNEYLYLRAEFENYKRQVIKERSDFRKYGSERLVVDLLNVLDIFDTALGTEVNSDNVDNFRKGIEMTANELRATLNRHGVEEVAAAGKPFDPSVHEALSSEETNEVSPGNVTRVFKKPYKLHDRVIRHGQVVVAKPKA